MLQKLDIYTQGTDFALPEEWVWILNVFMTCNTSSSGQQLTLRHLSGTLDHVGDLGPCLTCFPPTVTSLHLHHIDNNYHLLTFLDAIPNLEKLEILFRSCEATWSEQNQQLPRVTLSDLVSLSIFISNPNHTNWLPYVRFPSLRDLAIHTQPYAREDIHGHASALSALIEASDCKITTLKLHSGSSSGSFMTTWWRDQ